MGNQAWRTRTREDLSLAYNARATVGGDISPYVTAYAERSAAARRDLSCREDQRYGETPAEYLDVFPGAGPRAPLMVFLHGGYWRALSAKESAFAAPGFVTAGAAFAAVNYALCPDVRLTEIVRQCRAAIAWLHRNAGMFGFDSERIYVSGSSAGGHLTGMMLAGDGWERDFGLPEGVVRGGVPVSGLFDLDPLSHTEVNDWVGMDAAEARAMSPIHGVAPMGRTLVAAWGETDPLEFKRQSLDYAARWAEALGPVDVFEAPGRNHFDVVLDLGDPGTRLGRAALTLAGLATGG